MSDQTMKKLIAILFSAIFVFAFGLMPITSRAYIYNNGQPGSQLVVDKQIKAVTDNNWHENLASPIFHRGDLIDFRIIVRNSGDQDLHNIQVRDNLPNYVVPIFYPGDYNASQEAISWQIDQLSAGQEVVKTLRVQVDKKANLPNQPLALTNQVVASNGNLSDNDQASFKVAAKNLPQAGGNIAVSGGIIFGLLALGYLARKFGRGELF